MHGFSWSLCHIYLYHQLHQNQMCWRLQVAWGPATVSSKAVFQLESSNMAAMYSSNCCLKECQLLSTFPTSFSPSSGLNVSISYKIAAWQILLLVPCVVLVYNWWDFVFRTMSLHSQFISTHSTCLHIADLSVLLVFLNDITYTAYCLMHSTGQLTYCNQDYTAYQHKKT